MQQRLKEKEHLSPQFNIPTHTGVLIGFLNPIEVEEGQDLNLSSSESTDKEPSGSYMLTLQQSLKEIAENLLPVLSNNLLIRRQIDPESGKALQCRLRSYQPKTTYHSCYAVLMSSTQELDQWQIKLIPVGMVLKEEP